MDRHTIRLDPVRDSTSVAALGYDHENKRLRVKFSRTGSVYDYLNVPLVKYVALCEAKSVGKTLNKLILPIHMAEKIT